MTGHPNDNVLRAFAANSLASTDLLDVGDHLAVCDACRTRAARLGGAAAVIEQLWHDWPEPSVHLTEDELQLYAESRLPADDAFRIRRHLTECEVCRLHAGELSAWTKARRPMRQVGFTVAAAAAVLVIGVLSARVWHSRESVPQTTAAADVLRSLSPGARAQFDAALRSGTAELPPTVADLASPRETLMGSKAERTAFEVIGPVGTAIVEDRPVMTWRPLAGDGAYVVTVSDESGNEVLHSAPVSDTRWVAPSPLPRGRTYTWQVSAQRNGRTRIAPTAPEPPARFRVLDLDRASELQRIARDFPDAHAVLGILSMQAGVRGLALAELARVRPGDAYADVARRSRERLEAAPLRPER